MSPGGQGEAPVYILLNGVSKSYGSGRARAEALREWTWRFAPEFVIVTGPPGSGKTTLIELVGATQRPTAGEIVVGGQRLDLLETAAVWSFGRTASRPDVGMANGYPSVVRRYARVEDHTKT